MKNIYRIIVLSLLSLVAGTASAQTNQPRPADWEKIVEAARKEGKVVASIPPSAELRKLMELAFSKRYGIGVEFVPARGGAIIRRMVDEAKADGCARSIFLQQRRTQVPTFLAAFDAPSIVFNCTARPRTTMPVTRSMSAWIGPITPNVSSTLSTPIRRLVFGLTPTNTRRRSFVPSTIS